MLHFKILDPSEHGQIPAEALAGQVLPDGCVVAAGVDEAGKIVATWCAVAVVHLEPLWVASEHRKSPYLLKRLWQILRATLSEMGVRHTLTVISPAVPVTEKIAEWCGAEKLDGSLYAFNVHEGDLLCLKQ